MNLQPHPEPHKAEHFYPQYKFAANLNPGEFFYPPGVDEPVAISDTLVNDTVDNALGDGSLRILDSTGTVHAFRRAKDNVVRMYWPGLNRVAPRTETEQSPGGPQ